MTKIVQLAEPLARRDEDRVAHSPKYLQIAELLLARIERGEWESGDLLPSEADLARLLPASLGTIQKALNHLSRRGIIIREQGKGTFVLWARTPDRFLKHFRFLQEDGKTLLPAYMRMLSVTLACEQGPWSRFLGIEPDYVHIRRLFNIGGEFDIFSEIYLSGSRFRELAGVECRELDGKSIRDLLRDRFNAPTLRVEQTFCCQVLPPRVCKEIALPLSAYGILWEICGRSYRDVPLTFQRVYMPPADRPLQVLDRCSEE